MPAASRHRSRSSSEPTDRRTMASAGGTMKALLRILLIFTFAVAQVYAQQGTPADSAELADNTRTTPEKDSQDTPQPPNTSLENKIDAMESDEPPDRTFKW